MSLTMEPSLSKLHLGCGDVYKEGYLNVDISHDSRADIYLDLNEIPWVWATDSIDEITTGDCFEHLFPLGKSEGQMNIVAVMKECHRVLKSGGLLDIIVPTTEGRGAWQDPTHVTYWNHNTFLYYITDEMNWRILKPGFGFKQDSIGHHVSEELGVVWCRAQLRK